MKRAVPTVAAISISALAVSLLISLLMIVESFASRRLYAQGEGVRIGQLQLAGDEANRAGDFILELEQMAPAPAGEHYEVWMQSEAGELLQLGEFTVDEGSVTFAGSSEQNLLRDYDSVLISLEPNDDPDDSAPTQVVLSSTLPSQFLILARQLLVGDTAGTLTALDNLQSQIAIASEANTLLTEALASEDYTDVRRRAEHIVNILDGESGAFFGDLDRDGEVQNPGDGSGVRVYLEQAQDIVLNILSTVTTTEELSAQAQQLLTMLEDSHALVEEARDKTQKIFAADTREESETIAADVDLLMTEFTDALAAINTTALGMVIYPFHSTSATASVGDEANQEARRLGELRLLDNEVARAGDFILTLEHMAPAPAGEHYEVWMQSDIGELLRLGDFGVNEGSVAYTGTTTENLLGNYNRVLITLELDKGPNEAPPTQIILSSTLPSQLLTFSRQLLANDTAGNTAIFDDLQSQIAIASEHSGFLVNALILEDMGEVRRHAEHIVNIFDGETGAFFGDLDRNGQAQNPGDGVGVNVYIEQTRNVMLNMLSVVTTTGDVGIEAQQIITTLAESQLLVEQSRKRALDIFGITSELDLLDAARDLVQTTTLLTTSAQQARDKILALVVYEFFAPSMPITSTRDIGSVPPQVSPEVTILPPLAVTAGEIWTHPLEAALYVFVPGGEATLGATTEDAMRATENPQHTVEVGGFWMRQSEVTNEHYMQCVDQGGCTPPNNSFWQDAELSEHPVTHVNWEQASAYARWVGGRLPTEAEWESACQGPAEQEYPWGDAAPTDELSNFLDSVGGTTAVSSYVDGANPYGLMDMSGNVWEWTSSADKLYPYNAGDGREDLATTQIRIGRGGSFSYPEQYLRCSARLGFHPAWQVSHLGFRVALSERE